MSFSRKIHINGFDYISHMRPTNKYIILCRYLGEDITVHEFAHSLMLLGFTQVAEVIRVRFYRVTQKNAPTEKIITKIECCGANEQNKHFPGPRGAS